MKHSMGIKVAGAALSGMLLAAGCQTVDPYTGEQKVSNTAKGAGIGAAAGAVIGAISGDDARERRRRALLGAGVGALAGGAVGAYMDKQEAELRKELQGTGVSVTRNGENITLNMPSNITFRTGSADLDSRFFKVLDSVALVLKKYEKTIVEVAGHTDSVGSEQTNQTLSERRANTVAQYLVGRGIKQERMIVIGAGETRPVASNDTQEGRALNRRVELTLMPLKQT
ncbi:MAG TPA: OmpA family protein [Burkholderiales bacterium]|jgi:outer membrane protein OmpA-like peptidoglycan-associated protein|nr:OmpA family protein [Burkholderiales bacterium]